MKIKRKSLNRKGDIPVTILVLGVVAICILAILSFYSSKIKIEDSFESVGKIEEMNSQIENNTFYGKPLPTSIEIKEKRLWILETDKVIFSVEYGP
ncbi:hypothetical protein BMS3Abin17_00536 [archaeon BMS3Abin17]|nr:hypothetical protein BMS3Abin17_00536 [archaeon BMS3Abin17]HDZ60446.1 hypothetical protein [Candidatus Pacearchaeota archaeon]